jgi:hypothetical protein
VAGGKKRGSEMDRKMDDYANRPDRGFRRIGSLTPTIANSPAVSGSTLTRSSESSVTTGRAAVTHASTGTRRSGTPVASSLSAVVAQMASGDPEATDRLLLASLPQSVARSLTPSMATWNDPAYGFDYEVTGYALAAPAPPDDDLDAARLLVATAMLPASARSVAGELARLAAVTKSRADTGEDQALRFAAFRDELGEFPIDVISSALRKIARREIFFPSLAEIRDQCQREFRHRQRLASALERRN